MEDLIKTVLAQTMEVEAVPDSWTSDTDLINDIGIDSLQIVQFMLALEDRLGISIDYEELTFDDFSSIRALASFLEKCS